MSSFSLPSPRISDARRPTTAISGSVHRLERVQSVRVQCKGAHFQRSGSIAQSPASDFCNKICQWQTYASRQNRASLDHLVGAGEQGWRDREAERFCSFEIDRKLVLGRLLYRQIGGLLAL